MIANARMYSVSPQVGSVWRSLICAIVDASGLPIEWLEHPAPAPLDELWCRPDLGAVFMCGLPFSRSNPQPLLVAAPVPSPPAFGAEARYWSEFVVRRDSAFQSVADTFGRRLALTVPDSQSGCLAALSHFESLYVPSKRSAPLFAEIIAPTITPLGALNAVIGGDADIAPIDSYAFSLLGVHRPDLTAAVRVVGRTIPTPIPPLVSSGIGVDALSAAFAVAHEDPALKPLMERLLLERFIRPDPSAYDVLRERCSAAQQFWRTRRLAAATHPAFAG